MRTTSRNGIMTGAPSYLESPIFIVAFPRSGTTLLEQTLDAHPRLKSMDEQPYLQNAIERLWPGPESVIRSAWLVDARRSSTQRETTTGAWSRGGSRCSRVSS